MNCWKLLVDYIYCENTAVSDGNVDFAPLNGLAVAVRRLVVSVMWASRTDVDGRPQYFDIGNFLRNALGLMIGLSDPGFCR